MHVIGFHKLANQLAQIDPSSPTSKEPHGKKDKQLICLDNDLSGGL